MQTSKRPFSTISTSTAQLLQAYLKPAKVQTSYVPPQQEEVLMSDFNLENGVDLSDLKPIAVKVEKVKVEGETLFQRYLRISLANIDLSIKEAKGRFNENDPSYSPYERPVKSKNWAPSKKEKAGPDDRIKVWASCGGTKKIALSKDGSEIIEVLGRDVVTTLERFRSFMSHPDFEKSSYGQAFLKLAEKSNSVQRGRKKKEDSSAP